METIPTNPIKELIAATDRARETTKADEVTARRNLAKEVRAITTPADRRLLTALRGMNSLIRRDGLTFMIDPARRRMGFERVTHYFRGTNSEGEDRLYTLQDGMEAGFSGSGCVVVKVKQYSPNWDQMPGELLDLSKFSLDTATVDRLRDGVGLRRAISQRHSYGWPIFGIEYQRRKSSGEIERRGNGFYDEWGITGHTVEYSWRGWMGEHSKWSGWNFSDLGAVIREFPDGSSSETGKYVAEPVLYVHLYQRTDGEVDPIAKGQERINALLKARYLGYLGEEIDLVNHENITPGNLLKGIAQ